MGGWGVYRPVCATVMLLQGPYGFILLNKIATLHPASPLLLLQTPLRRPRGKIRKSFLYADGFELLRCIFMRRVLHRV